jgi:hypothetical protein
MKFIFEDSDLLGLLAAEYRGTRDKSERVRISAEYAVVVDRLIKSGTWTEMPSSEDMLPDEDMPQAFWDYLFSDEPDRIARDST